MVIASKENYNCDYLDIFLIQYSFDELMDWSICHLLIIGGLPSRKNILGRDLY